MKICIVIPAHNESRFIGPLIKRIKAKGLDIIVIDDGSTDGSGRLAGENGAYVLQNVVRSGKGSSLQRGFEYALKNHYTGIITMDGDGQHDPDDLDNFLKQISESPESIITGNRMDSRQGMPWVRRLTNQLMSGLISVICKQRVPDTQCGYRYISSVILRSIKLECRDFEIETEVLVQASKKGFRVYSVAVKTIYRDEDSKINPVKDTLRFFSYIFREIFYPRLR